MATDGEFSRYQEVLIMGRDLFGTDEVMEQLSSLHHGEVEWVVL